MLPSARGIALLALTLICGMTGHDARAAQYPVSNETELRQALANANTNSDPTPVIVLTSDITISDPTPIVAPNKPVTIETGAFNLKGVDAGAGNGTSLAFQGGILTLNGALTGGNGPNIGGSGLTMTGGSAVNNGTIAAGQSGAAATASNAVELTGATLQNKGTITAVVLNNTIQVQLNTGSVLLNEGTIRTNIVSSGNATIINDGIVNGLIGLSGNNNTLELRAGSNITQNGPNTVRSLGNNDTLALGGSVDSSFDVTQVSGSFPLPARKFMNFDAFVKTGTSTWTLTGQTGYRMPWQLRGGTLSISSDANLGGATGGPTGTLTFDGGALRNTAAFLSARAATIDAGGGTFDTQANLIWSGVISGMGALNKTGSASLILTGANTYAGGTIISAGTLQIGNGGTLGSIQGNIVNNGTLAFARTDDMTFTQLISGSGAVTLAQPNKTTFTADNTYTGVTTISSGTLQLGNGGTSGAIAGDVINNGVFALNRQDTLALPGNISGSGRVEQNGTGTTVLTGDATHTGGTIINAGALQIGNGATRGSIQGSVQNNGTLAFDRADTLAFNGTVSGSGVIRQIGTGITQFTGDSSGFTGSTMVENGVLAVNGKLCGAMGVGNGGTLGGVGTVCGTTNTGTVAPGNSIGTLTINGNYVGNGGTLETEAVLGGDNSPADRLVVSGNTSGNTQVRVINRGGTGAQTVEGIKIVDVGGISAGNFTLVGDYSIAGQPAVVAGAYAYTLQKNGVSTPTDGDWYLRSSLAPVEPEPPGEPGTPPPSSGPNGPPPAGPIYQPGVPVYEAYPSMLQALNALPTVQQRNVGRYWAISGDRGSSSGISSSGSSPDSRADGDPLSTSSSASSRLGQGLWARTEGQQGRLRPGNATTDTSTDYRLWRMQVGVDHSIAANTQGRLVAGLNAQYANLSSTVDSRYGRGDTGVDAYGVGATLTWYGNNGVYVDGQAQLNWFDSTLSSRTLGRTLVRDNSGNGYAVGVETGKRIGIANGWGITPQAQLTYSSVDFSSFTDPYGARVSMDTGDSLMGRLGVTADYQNETSNAAGKTDRRFNVYGSANVYYEFLDGTSVNVSDVRISSNGARAAVGLAAGAGYGWSKDKYAVYGEVSARTGLDNPGRSYAYTGTIGVRMRF